MRQKMTRREDYLKLIYTLSQKGEAHGADIADILNVKRPTVSIYLKRLVETGDITMDEHHCIHLTEQGEAIAKSTLTKHSMLFALLQELGVPTAVAAEDACAIEHVISPETYGALNLLWQRRQVSL